MNEKTTSDKTNRFLPPANGFTETGSQKQCHFEAFNTSSFQSTKKFHSNRIWLLLINAFIIKNHIECFTILILEFRYEALIKMDQLHWRQFLVLIISSRVLTWLKGFRGVLHVLQVLLWDRLRWFLDNFPPPLRRQGPQHLRTRLEPNLPLPIV